MANRNDNRGFDERERGRRGRWDERRSFDERDERREAELRRYRSRYDQDRVGYGHGQEYGMEAGGPRTRREDEYGHQAREEWRDTDRSAYGELRRTGPNVGIDRYGQPNDYAYRPSEEDFDPDYLAWRDEQLRGHDRDYAEWRRTQHQQYDEDYRRFRHERRAQFGQTFQDWRSRNSLVGGVPDTTVAPGVNYTGERSSHSGGWTGGYGPKPSGMLDPSLNMAADPALSQTGGGPRPTGGPTATASPGPEFGKEPPQVRAASEGDIRREEPKDERKAR